MSLGVAESAAGRQVVGENIGQTFGFVVTGNADLGLVALAQVLDFDGAAPKDWTQLDDTLHTPIRQDMVLLSDSAEPRCHPRWGTIYLPGILKALLARYTHSRSVERRTHCSKSSFWEHLHRHPPSTVVYRRRLSFMTNTVF